VPRLWTKRENRTAHFRPTQTKQDWSIRRAAVDRISNQSLLAEIAVNATDRAVRRAAVERITDQTLLAKMAFDGKDLSVRRSAIERITDQTSLAKIAIEEQNPFLRRVAIERLTDPELLAEMGMWVKPELTQKVDDKPYWRKLPSRLRNGMSGALPWRGF